MPTTPSTIYEVNALIHRLKDARRSTHPHRTKKFKTCREALASELRKRRMLTTRIQALPQELQDSILHFTLYQPVQVNIVHITKKYKPPLGLQVTRHIRATFAKAYYSHTIFQFGSSEDRLKIRDLSLSPACQLCRSWLSSLAASEGKLITTIRLNFGRWRWPATSRTGNLYRTWPFNGVASSISQSCRLNFNLRHNVLYFRLPGPDEEAQWHRGAPADGWP